MSESSNPIKSSTHVLLIHQSAGLGGATRSMSSTIQALRESGATATVLAPPGTMVKEWQDLGAEVFSWVPPACTWFFANLFGSLESSMDLNGLSFQMVQMARLPKLVFQAKRRIQEIVDQKSITIIYVNSMALFPIARSLAAIQKKRPLQIIWHVREPARNSLPFWLQSIVVNGVAKASNAIAAISSNEARAFDSKVAVTVIHNAVPEEWASQKSAPQASLATKRVVMASSFFPSKGIQDFLSMARIVCEQCPDAEIVLYTGRPDLHRGSVSSILGFAGKWNGRVDLTLDIMKDVTQCILENRIRVIFNHSVDVNALLEASVYVRADRAACPWGRDIIEAMWVGLPVVATGTSEEFVQEGHTGFLVPPYRPDLMADRVCRLLNDTDLRKAMGRKGFIRGRKMFSPELHKEKLLKVFNINRT